MTCFCLEVSACTCLPKRPVKTEMKNVDAVIVGTILSKSIVTVIDSTVFKSFPNDSTMQKSPMYTINIARYNLVVERIYKGNISKDTLTIYSGVGRGSCGINFDIGKKYIIYGMKEWNLEDFQFPNGINIFWTGLCSRTTSYFKTEITEIEKFATAQKIGSQDR